MYQCLLHHWANMSEPCQHCGRENTSEPSNAITVDNQGYTRVSPAIIEALIYLIAKIPENRYGLTYPAYELVNKLEGELK